MSELRVDENDNFGELTLQDTFMLHISAEVLSAVFEQEVAFRGKAQVV